MALSEAEELELLELEEQEALAKRATETKAPRQNKYSVADAAIMGVGDAATMGTRGAIRGAGGAVGQALGVFTGLKGFPLKERVEHALKEGKEQFFKSRANANEELEEASDEHPIANIAGNVGGMLLTAPLVAAKGLAGSVKLGTMMGAGNALSTADSLDEAAIKL
jgi:hypothetical protein